MKSENRFSTIISRGSLLTLAGIIHPTGLDSAERAIGNSETLTNSSIFFLCRVYSKLYVINFTFGQAVAGAHKFGLGERTKLGKGNGGIGWPRPNMEYKIDRIKIQRNIQ